MHQWQGQQQDTDGRKDKDTICTKGRDSSKTLTEGRTRTGFAPKAGTAARTRDLVGKEKVRGGKIKGTWWEKERDLVEKRKGTR